MFSIILLQNAKDQIFSSCIHEEYIEIFIHGNKKLKI